jgi:hypothetical protein
MSRPLGWRKDRYDPKDYLHRKLVRLLIPDSFSLEEYLPEVRDQGNIGSCVGFGIGGNLTGLARGQDAFEEWFSPTWIYNGARFLAGDLNYDAGAYPRDALDWISENGCLLEHFWPYDPYKLDKTSPPSNLVEEALKRPILAYFRVTGGTEGICSALSLGCFVSIGVPWFDKWMDTDRDGNLAEVTELDDVAGGHEVFLYGYDIPKQLFYGQNSWGKEWGKNGRFTMPFSAFDVFKQFGGYDAHYVAVDWAKEPEPPVPPEPVPPTPPEPEPENWFVKFIKWLWELIKKIFAG